MIGNTRIPRRTVLRGAGAALALPALEAMAFPADAGRAPVRLAYIFVPNGMNMDRWRIADEGELKKLSPTLEPLEPVRRKLLAFTGLSHDKANANGDGPGDHARSNATFLTGCQARKTSGKDIQVGISVDQVAAQKAGSKTRLASLELGIEKGRDAGGCDSGYSCAYSSNISWRTPTSPMGKEINPRLVFERLFGDPDAVKADKARARRAMYDRSVLDLVREDAKRLSGRLGTADRAKLDEYQESVRAVERRVQSIQEDAEKQIPDVDLPDRVPRDPKAHIRLMADLLVLAFRSDLTRVATFSFANDGSNRTFPDIGVRQGHHSISHHGKNPEKLADIGKIDRFYVEQKLDAVKESGGTLLDNSLVVYGCAIADGHRHRHMDLPIVMAGRGGGTVKTGRHLKYDSGTPLCNLYLSMLDRVGLEEKSFGDSTGRLELG